MVYRADISVTTYGAPDEYGRMSLLVQHNDALDGQRRGQCYFAVPADVVERLRHNIAEDFWRRRRQRLERKESR